MKATLQLLLLPLLLILASNAFAQTSSIFVIPIETEIDNSALHHFNTGLKQAHEANADLLLLKLNTYGGAVDAADSIRTALLRLDMPTVAFVDVNAASAGALIALACDSVYMAPGASMGSSTVVNGVGEPMPEKYQSYMSTIMRATAEGHGRIIDGDSTKWRRDPNIAASMVDPTTSLSLTCRQAIECGYADGIATNITDVVAQLNREDSRVVYYESTISDDILGFLSNAAVRAVLVMLIIGGIYMEMHTPGLGFAAAVAVVASILYFLPVLITGIIPSWALLCLIGGIILVALEVFVIPGFGVCGICGIIALGASLVGAYATGDSSFGISAIGKSLCIVGSGTLAAILLALYLTSSRGPKCFRRHTELMTTLNVDDGFVGVDMSPAQYVGMTARTTTVLRPAGKIEINSNTYDAVSTGEFIAANRPVKIQRYENAQLYVSEITE